MNEPFNRVSDLCTCFILCNVFAADPAGELLGADGGADEGEDGGRGSRRDERDAGGPAQPHPTTQGEDQLNHILPHKVRTSLTTSYHIR